MADGLVSVIIPTRDRKEVLRRTLDSLTRQTLPPEDFEVIVVDDGSSDGTADLAGESYPFALHFLRREGQGATLARNAGAEHSRGRSLIFLDDDISLRPETLAALSEACASHERSVVLGALVTPEEVKTSVFARLNADEMPAPSAAPSGLMEVEFSRCKTGLMAIRRSDLFELGLFQDPTGGWPNWDDVALGYRAFQAGFRFWESTRAIGEHRDYSLKDLRASSLRWQRASRSAVRLFQKYPDLQPHIAMLHDKTPIAWRRDPPGLIGRKLLRRAASARPLLGSLMWLGSALERWYPSPALLRPLYRWVMGGYMFWGFRMGLEENGR